LITITYGCRKERIIKDPGALLSFSTDTLTFDTVFTTIGSSTRHFKVFNPYNQSIIISSITLAGGQASSFRMNVDGLPGIAFSDLQIAPKDSMYIFVEVTVDPNNDNLPFVIYDSITFVTNGNPQRVVLEAYGQNAHFYSDQRVCDVWNDDLPYVILKSILVDSNCTLTITEGVNIYLHANAYIFVRPTATLKVQGTKDSLVTFEGDRLEHFFDDLPGQWGGILFLRGSTGNEIRHARISEATSGIIIGSSTSTDLADFTYPNKPNVSIYQTEIRNCSQWGIFSFFSDVKAENCLIYGCGDNNLALLFGGAHEFTHCTVANYGVIGITHTTPVLRLTNYAMQDQVAFLADFSATFTNSIFYGSKSVGTDPADGEIELDFLDVPGVGDTTYVFDHCILRTNMQKGPPLFESVLLNEDPRFENIEEDDYTPDDSSPAIDAGKDLPGFAEDLFGNPRPVGPRWDIGAIERQ